jgi:hypothetical protein
VALYSNVRCFKSAVSFNNSYGVRREIRFTDVAYRTMLFDYVSRILCIDRCYVYLGVDALDMKALARLPRRFVIGSCNRTCNINYRHEIKTSSFNRQRSDVRANSKVDRQIRLCRTTVNDPQ